MRISTIVVAALLGAATLAPAAHADEVWGNENTNVFWVENAGDYAVLEFTIDDPKTHRTGRIFVNGLVATDANRWTFGGYWATNDERAARCPMPIIDAAGNENWTWGFVELTFLERAFPAAWSAALGLCFDEAQEFWTVQPIVGE